MYSIQGCSLFSPLELLQDLAELSKKLHPIAAQWNILGIQLGFYPGDLHAIQVQVQHDPVEALNMLLEKWLRRTDPPPTLEAMVNVIGGRAIANRRLGRKLEDERGDFLILKCKQPCILQNRHCSL